MLYFFFIFTWQVQIQYTNEGEVKSGVVDIADRYFSQKSDNLYLMNISSKKKMTALYNYEQKISMPCWGRRKEVIDHMLIHQPCFPVDI